MLTSENVAPTKWGPFVRIDNNNRLHNTMTDGFQNSEKMYHCIAVDCMGWRQYHLSHFKGSEEGVQNHGYCGHAGRPELDEGFRRAAGPCDDFPGLSIGRLLRPARRGVLKILLPAVGRHIEQRPAIRERFGAARVSRIGVKDVIADAEENAQAVLLA